MNLPTLTAGTSLTLSGAGHGLWANEETGRRHREEERKMIRALQNYVTYTTVQNFGNNNEYNEIKSEYYQYSNKWIEKYLKVTCQWFNLICSNLTFFPHLKTKLHQKWHEDLTGDNMNYKWWTTKLMKQPAFERFGKWKCHAIHARFNVLTLNAHCSNKNEL